MWSMKIIVSQKVSYQISRIKGLGDRISVRVAEMVHLGKHGNGDGPNT